MTPTDLNQLWQLLQAHAWIPLAALLIHIFIRFEKANPWVDSRVPARWRPLVALVLGQVAAILDALTQGTKWPMAVAGGLLATLSAVFAHDFFIEGLRNGKELGAGSPPPSGGASANLKTPVTPMRPPLVPPTMAARRMVVAVGFVLALGACNLPPKTVHDIAEVTLSVEQAACVLTEDLMGTTEPAAIATVCGIPSNAIQAIIDLVTAHHQAMAKAAAEKAQEAAVRAALSRDAGGDR